MGVEKVGFRGERDAEPSVAAGQQPCQWFRTLTAGAAVSDRLHELPLSTVRGRWDRRWPETVASGADPLHAAQARQLATAQLRPSMNFLRSATERRVLPCPLGSVRDPAGQLCNRSVRIIRAAVAVLAQPSAHIGGGGRIQRSPLIYRGIPIASRHEEHHENHHPHPRPRARNP